MFYDKLDFKSKVDITFFAAWWGFSLSSGNPCYHPPRFPGINANIIYAGEMFHFPMMVYAYQFDTQKLSNAMSVYYESPCPVRSLCNMWALAPELPPTAPLFSFSDRRQVRCLEYRVFEDRVGQLVSSCGLNPDNYSGHSFLRGGCTWAWQHRASPQIIMSQGDWRSCSWMNYAVISFPSWWQVARPMSNSLRNYI